MVKMKKDSRSIRVQHLHNILLSKYLPSEEVNRVFKTSEILESFDKKIFLETYNGLGGKIENPEIFFSIPFMEFGRFCVLLDEPIHFNRYRSRTLRASFYEGLSSFPLMKYRTYSRKHEVECLKVGTSRPYWTNDEAEKHFGPSQQSGDLGLAGSSGWKMIALKDFTIDLLARQRKIRLLRISVWDDLMVSKNLQKFNDLLMSPGSVESEMILKYIERKVVALYADDF